MANKINDRITLLRNLLKLSRADVERKYQLSQETLKAWEYGKNNINNTNIDFLLNIYRNEGVLVTKEWLVKGTGISPTSSVTANKINSEEFNFLMDEPFQMEREIKFLLNLNPDYISFRVNNDSMTPKFQNDSIVIGKKRFASDITKTVGKDCIIKIKGKKDILLRRIGLTEKNKYILSVLNPIDLVEDPIIIASELDFSAPVIFVRYCDY
ncbi:helix-turn-helix domain-containing protein [Fluviispira vulneris]|uniref:helix-turn-helix domain-containing protein n=1 Tax=Fluviispira vulneris TaxID=2763012 RepID=UPI00164541CA|nr:helix-turn-helix transcriptional regulator [Fluviispira vulneris]